TGVRLLAGRAAAGQRGGAGGGRGVVRRGLVARPSPFDERGAGMSRDWRGTLPGAEHTLGGLTCLPRGTLGGHTCLPRGTLGGLTRLPRGTLFGGYGPFVALVALVLAMALLAP